MRRQSRPWLYALAVATLMGLGVGAWANMYGEYDPRSIQYVLWKHGVHSMNLDTAAAIAGNWGDLDVIAGKQESELREKFGYVTDVKDARPYLRACVEGSSLPDKKGVFLRDSIYYVMFRNNRAYTIVTVKGC